MPASPGNKPGYTRQPVPDAIKSLGRIIGWGAFLACSWTWCIGMFLPVLLRRDFGPASFWVFAIPNVVGAALMGVLLHRPGASREFVQRHHLAALVFSAVTIAFQWYFALWQLKFGWQPMGIVIGSGLLAAFASRTKFGPLWAAVSWLASLVCAVLWRSEQGLRAGPTPLLPADHLMPLAAVCVLGFALCPWLDLTFHAARQALPGRTGSWAFIVGFGVLFFAMILFTHAYGPHLLATPAGEPLITGLLMGHIAWQLGYTMGVHGAAAAGLQSHGAEPPRAGRALTPVVVGGLFGLAGIFASAGMSQWGELLYRSFMVFYGLIFPAYIVTCAPRLPGAPGPTRRQFAVLAGVVLLALPCYWLGFMEKQTWWLLPGVLIVLAGRLFIGRGESPARPELSPAPAPALARLN